MSERYARFHTVPAAHQRDARSPGRRDRDRVLYSSAFRRLSGITQVVAPDDRHPIHNRLTHTLEVAQIGRSLAEQFLRDDANHDLIGRVGGLDPDVVEAACLAHDLGHPPFGHVAEAELDQLLKAQGVDGGFEGNPQTFRILNKLTVRYRESDGLNLTRATLCAVLKYPWLRGTDGRTARKWGAYESERAEFEWAHELLAAHARKRSLEAEIMDWADDIAYAVHDVEDFYRAGLIPLDRLATPGSAELDRFLETEVARTDELRRLDPARLREQFQNLLDIAPVDSPYAGTREGRSRLRSFTSSLVDRYINAARLVEPEGDGPVLQIDPEPHMEVMLLKGLTWQYVIESRALITQRYGYRKLIQSLFATLCDASSSEQDRRVLPDFYRDLLGNAPSDVLIARTVTDLISSLTEMQVVALHHRLTGIAMGASLDPILP